MVNDLMPVVAANLRRLRGEQGRSLSELARASGIAKATLSALEAGRGNPTIETLSSLATALGVPFGDLLASGAPEPVHVVRAAEGTSVPGTANTLRLIVRLPGARRSSSTRRASRRAPSARRAGTGRARVSTCSSRRVRCAPAPSIRRPICAPATTPVSPATRCTSTRPDRAAPAHCSSCSGPPNHDHLRRQNGARDRRQRRHRTPDRRAARRGGATLALHYSSNPEPAQELASALPKAAAFEADLGEPDAPDRLVDEVESVFGRVDVLVANHGRSQVARLEQVDADAFDEMLAVNLRAPFLLARRTIPTMGEHGFGRVLFMSSVAGLTGGIVGPHYAASKAGLHGLTHYLARRAAGEGVTVNALAPALIEDTACSPATPAPWPR